MQVPSWEFFPKTHWNFKWGGKRSRNGEPQTALILHPPLLGPNGNAMFTALRVHWFMLSSAFCFVRKKGGRGIVIMSRGACEGSVSYQLFNAITVCCNWSVWSFAVRWTHSTRSVWVFPKAKLCFIACGRFWKKQANVGNSRGIFYNLSSSAITRGLPGTSNFTASLQVDT